MLLSVRVEVDWSPMLVVLLFSNLFTERMFLSGYILESVDRESCGIYYYYDCSDMFLLIYKPFNFFIWPRPEDIYRCFTTKLGSGKF